MPLHKGKSEKAFKENVRTEYKHGKPLKQSLAIAYSMQRKAKKKMADGGSTSPTPTPTPTPVILDADKAASFRKGFKSVFAKGGDVYDQKGVHLPVNKMHPEMSDTNMHSKSNPEEAKRRHQAKLEELKAMPKPKLCAHGGPTHCMEGCYAHGGQITDNYQPDHGVDNFHPVSEFGSGYESHQGNAVKRNSSAHSEDDKDLNQHPVHAMDSGDEDIVDRIMHQRSKTYESEARNYSEGGKVANECDEYADFAPNEFDDLVLRDDLESTYGDDDNSGDALGNEQEDQDRKDIVARIMASRRKKDRLPNPR